MSSEQRKGISELEQTFTSKPTRTAGIVATDNLFHIVNVVDRFKKENDTNLI